jgi:signal transduction histidine kinase
VTGWVAIAVTVLGLPFLVGQHYAQGPALIRLYLFVLFLAFDVAVPLFCGLWIRTRRRSLERLVTANAQLEAAVRAEERNKIAREMHDVVAHRIALIVLHSASVKGEQGELIGQLGRTALHELRDVLGVLRHGPTRKGEPPAVAEAPLQLQLETLVAQARAAGVPVEMRMEGEALPPSGDAAQVAREHTVLRVAQEALTNVIKHAPGAGTVLTVRGGTGTMEIVVENEPRPKRAGLARNHEFPRSGMGLMGLRERVSLLDGTLDTVMRADGGYRVCATLPTVPARS